MLAALDPRKLARVSFPLGEQDKEATRAEAERAGLAAARKPESQEACFLAGDDYRAFLGRQGLEPQEGTIVAEDGSELGRHDGFWRFTPGQRRGLGLAAPEPLYVLGTRPVRERRRRRPARRARAHGGDRARPALRRRRAGRGEASLPLACGTGPRSSRPPAASGSQLDEPATASRPARLRCSTTATQSSAMA